jgi:hypothetical protein
MTNHDYKKHHEIPVTRSFADSQSISRYGTRLQPYQQGTLGDLGGRDFFALFRAENDERTGNSCQPHNRIG